MNYEELEQDPREALSYFIRSPFYSERGHFVYELIQR
jgi:hypothetical protein